ncbi:MAG: serine/threonine-protein kinase [Microthrixaceae bacterium]
MTSRDFSASRVGVVLADRYEVTRFIAQGGMSDVYEATDRVLGRQCAVKVYRATALADRSRFDVEVRILAALNHPGLVHVFDAGEHDGDEFVVLELIDGPTLATVLADRGPLPPAEVRELADALADALAYVHAAGIVHRDVTPSNILCGSDGRARLADFGIARLLDASRVTSLAHTIGTVAYMAPEQVEGGDVTPAADVYALGLVLVEALSGRPGFDGVGHEVALARLARDPDVETGVPDHWPPLLREMTARAPDARPGAMTVRDRLRELPILASSDVTAATAVTPLLAAPGAADLGGAALAATEVVPVASGTTVMPAMSLPAVASDARARRIGWAAGVAFVRWRVPLAIAAVVLLGVVTALASGGDQAGNVTPTTTEPAAVTVTTAPPTTVPTTAPPTTKPPGGKGRGEGKNNDD